MRVMGSQGRLKQHNQWLRWAPVLPCVAFLLLLLWQLALLSEMSTASMELSSTPNSERVSEATTGEAGPISHQQNNAAEQQQSPTDLLETTPSHRHGLSIQRSTLDHLKTLGPFPKIFHLTWPDKDVMNKSFAILEQGAKNLKRLNPEWKFIVHDDSAINNAIQNFHHPDVPESMNGDLVRAHIVEKTDMFRLIIIYQMGGLYSDIDRAMNVLLSDRVQEDTAKMVIPTHYDMGFTQDLYGSSPGNDIILSIIKNRCQKREKLPLKNGWLKGGDLASLTDLYSRTIETALFGQKLQRSNETLWDEARHLLDSHSAGMIVTKKDVWCDGFLVSDYPGCKSLSREPLYNAYNITHWAKEVNDMWEKKGE